MIQAHAVIDSLEKTRVRVKKAVKLGGPTPQGCDEVLQTLKNGIASSTKFLFEDADRLPIAAADAFNIVAPADLCYFETTMARYETLAGEEVETARPTRRGVLVSSSGEGATTGVVFVENRRDLWGRYGRFSALEIGFRLHRDEEEGTVLLTFCDVMKGAAPPSALVQKAVSNAASSFVNCNNVLSCNNVSTRTISPPKRLAKKRAKNGKYPLFEYKILHLAHRQGQGAGTSVSGRLSPRLHLRRGHARRLPNGSTAWVLPCVVGSKEKGMIVKEYHHKAAK